MSRYDDQLRWSKHPDAIQLCEEMAEEMALPSDSGDLFGWGASVAEDRESRWMGGDAR